MYVYDNVVKSVHVFEKKNEKFEMIRIGHLK